MSPWYQTRVWIHQAENAVPQAFHVVTSALGITLKRPGRPEEWGPSKAITLSRLLLVVFKEDLSKTEVNQKHSVILDSDVVGLDISVKVTDVVELLDCFDHLNENLLKSELIWYSFSIKVLLNWVFSVLRLYCAVIIEVSAFVTPWYALDTLLLKLLVVIQLLLNTFGALQVTFTGSLDSYLTLLSFFLVILVEVYNAEAATAELLPI